MTPAGDVPTGVFSFAENHTKEDSMEQGKVKFFNATKGFGFITTQAREDVFFHKSDVKSAGFRSTLNQGDIVEFEIRIEQKGKRAYNINRI